MPVLEIEKIYRNKEEVKEYHKAIEHAESWRFIGNCVWNFNIPQILEKLKISDRELAAQSLGMEAWNRLYGFLDDLSSEEWQQFEEAVRRRPLFEKRGNP